MKNIDIKDYLYHGIIDWLNYDNGKARENLCLEKLESILKSRYIYRPLEFKKNGITHTNTANHYTHFFTFVACHPKSVFAEKFKKNLDEDNGYTVATAYSKYGLLLSPKLLDELTISDVVFCDKEIVLEDNISLDKYGVGIYINPMEIQDESFGIIKQLIEKYGYDYDIISIFDSAIVESLEEEREKINKLSLKL